MLSVITAAAKHRGLILILARQELLQRYAGTSAGLAWAFAQPLLLVLVYYFVFSLGLKLELSGQAPYILVFLAGFIPWWTFNEAILKSAHSITSNPHLVKKILFPVEVLPVASLLASLVGHAVMLALVVILILASGFEVGARLLLIPYYLFALSVLSLGLGWLMAASNVVFRDIGQALPVLLNVWFWATPIVWPVSMLPVEFHWLVRWNPLWFVVNGYREALISQGPAWPPANASIFFWLVALAVFCLGALVFSRFKAELADQI